MLRQENQVIITTTHFPEKKTDPPHVLAVVCITHIFIRLSSRCVCVCDRWNDGGGGDPVIESACHIVYRCAHLLWAKKPSGADEFKCGTIDTRQKFNSDLVSIFPSFNI
jgi:hypothetical protein